MEEALHLLEDAAQDGGQIERRGKGPRGVMEEPEMLERGCGVLGGVGHRLQSIVPRRSALRIRCGSRFVLPGSAPDRPGHAVRFAACLDVAGNAKSAGR